MSSLSEFLLSLLQEASESLPGVTPRRMFGCDALFADGAIFALIWKTGRIGLKIQDPGQFAELLALPGAERWAPGSTAMAHWVLVPESFHDDGELLETWVRRAHQQAKSAGPPVKKAKQRAAELAPEPLASAPKKKAAATKAAAVRASKQPAVKKTERGSSAAR